MAATRKAAQPSEPEMERQGKSRLGTVVKLIVMALILLVLVAGALAVLARYQVVTVPYISELPFIMPEEEPASTPELTELQKATQENDQLQETIKDQQVEIEALNEDLDKLKKESQTALKKQTEYEKTIEDLQKQIIDLQGGQSSQKAAYKQIAQYFIEMKAADAANIIVKLDDNDIIGILTEMPDDTAASILSKMPVDRATAITKKMLATSP